MTIVISSAYGFFERQATGVFGHRQATFCRRRIREKSSCPMTRQLMENRLDETEQRFQETVTLRNKMKAAVDSWRSKPDKMPTGKMICHLIEEFSGETLKKSSR